MATKLFDVEFYSMEEIDKNIQVSLDELYSIQDKSTEAFNLLEETQNSIQRKRDMLNNIESYSMEQISNEIGDRPDYSILGVEVTTYSLESHGSYHGLYFSLEEDKSIIGKVIDFIKKVIKSIADAIKKVFKWIGRKLGLIKDNGDKVLSNIKNKRNSISDRFINLCVVHENRPSRLKYTNITVGYTEILVYGDNGYNDLITNLKKELAEHKIDNKIVDKIEEYAKSGKDITTIKNVGEFKLYWNTTSKEYKKILDKLSDMERVRMKKQFDKDSKKFDDFFEKMKEDTKKSTNQRKNHKQPKEEVIDTEIIVDTYTDKGVTWINEHFQTLIVFNQFTEGFFISLSSGKHIEYLDHYIKMAKAGFNTWYPYSIIPDTHTATINKILKSEVMPLEQNGVKTRSTSIPVCDRSNVGLLGYYKDNNSGNLTSYKYVKTTIQPKARRYLPNGTKVINGIKSKNIKEFLDSKETFVREMLPTINKHENRFVTAVEVTSSLIEKLTKEYDKKTSKGKQINKGELEALKTMSIALPRAIMDSAVSYTNLYQDTLTLTNMEVNTVTQTN